MDKSEIPEPVDLEVTAPTAPAARAAKRTAFIGALVGMAALAGTIVGVGAIANAQDDEPATTSTPGAAEADDQNTLDEGESEGGTDADHLSEFFDPDFQAFEDCMAGQLGDLWIEPQIFEGELPFGEFEDGEFPFDPEELAFEEFAFADGDMIETMPFPGEPFSEEDEQRFADADEACRDLLPEEVKAEIEAWRPYEECIDNQIGDLADPWADNTEPSEADWEAHDAAWKAADEACRDLLPAEVQEEMAAWDAFDDCLRDAGVFDEEPFGLSSVHIETGDGFQIAEFGDTDGSVTISGTAGDLSVTSTGGVTILDEAALDAQWEAIDAAHQDCENLLPEDLKGEFGSFGDMGFGDQEVFVD